MNRLHSRVLISALSSVLCMSAARSQTTPPPENVLALSASATSDVPYDVLVVTFSTSKDGADAGAVQSQLKLALDAALKVAKAAAKPEQVEVRTGNFSLYPRTSPKGTGITGWQGSAELVVQGQDFAAIGDLVGRITTMSVANTQFRLSREAARRAENDLAKEAIGQYRARADALTKQFGFSSFTIRDVNVGSNGQLFAPAMAPRLRSLSVSAEPLPVEAGTTTVTVNVSGTVQMR